MLIPNSVSSNGDVVLWKRQYQVTNNASATYILQLSEPPGVTFSANLSGVNTTYAPGQITFTGIGPGTQVITILIEYNITNVALGPFTFQVDRLSGPDTNLTNNLGVDILETEFCPPDAGAVDDPFGCVCGSCATDDTPCSSCTTEWRLQAGSEVNCTVSIEASTGNYNLTYINPNLPASFQYHIWCINCTDGGDYQVSGPATVSVQPLFTASVVKTFVKEDFILSLGDTSVIIANMPLPGETVFAYRNGLELPFTDYAVLGTVVTFLLPFGNSPFGAGPETITIHYFI